MLEKHDINNIFLATDDIYYQDLVIKNFKDLVRYRERTVSLDGKPVHFLCSKDERYRFDREVMFDTYLLAMSNYFLYSFSNTSYLALTIGINNFKKIDCINIPLQKQTQTSYGFGVEIK
jgi:hypothetical protein